MPTDTASSQYIQFAVKDISYFGLGCAAGNSGRQLASLQFLFKYVVKPQSPPRAPTPNEYGFWV